MSYIKEKYINGAIAPKHWTEQVVKPKPWYYDTINAVDWTNQAILPKSYKDATASFTGTKYIYKPNPKAPANPYLSNYNDPKEVNSMRDVILGTFNKNMKHSKMFGEDAANIPGLNMVADLLEHSWKHYLNPALKGKLLTVALNTLTDLSEDFDSYVYPIKAFMIEQSKIFTQDVNPEEALQNGFKKAWGALFGSEEGFVNYDYEFGEGAGANVLEFLAEFVSDPVNLVSFGTKAVLKQGFKGLRKEAMQSILKETQGEITEQQAKKYAKKFIKNTVNNIDAKSVNNIFKYNKELTDDQAMALYKGYLKTSFNDLSDDTITKIAKAQAPEKIKELLKYNISAEIKRGSLESYGSVIKKLKDKYDLSDEIAERIIKGYANTASDLVTNKLLKMGSTVSGALGLRSLKWDDVITKTILRTGFVPSGLTPLLHARKGFISVKDAHFLKKGKDIFLNKPIAYSETEGITEGIVETVEKAMAIGDVSQDEARVYISAAIGNALVSIDDILTNSEIVGENQYNLILQTFQKLSDTVEFKSIDDVINYLDNLNSAQLERLGLNSVGFEGYITEIKKINEIAKEDLEIEKISKILADPQTRVKLAEAEDFTKVIDRISQQGGDIKDVPEFLNKLVEVIKDTDSKHVVDKQIKIETLMNSIYKITNSDGAQRLEAIKELLDYLKGIQSALKSSNPGRALKNKYNAKVYFKLQKLIDMLEHFDDIEDAMELFRTDFLRKRKYAKFYEVMSVTFPKRRHKAIAELEDAIANTKYPKVAQRKQAQIEALKKEIVTFNRDVAKYKVAQNQSADKAVRNFLIRKLEPLNEFVDFLYKSRRATDYNLQKFLKKYKLEDIMQVLYNSEQGINKSIIDNITNLKYQRSNYIIDNLKTSNDAYKNAKTVISDYNEYYKTLGNYESYTKVLKGSIDKEMLQQNLKRVEALKQAIDATFQAKSKSKVPLMSIKHNAKLTKEQVIEYITKVTEDPSNALYNDFEYLEYSFRKFSEDYVRYTQKDGAETPERISELFNEALTSLKRYQQSLKNFKERIKKEPELFELLYKNLHKQHQQLSMSFNNMFKEIDKPKNKKLFNIYIQNRILRISENAPLGNVQTKRAEYQGIVRNSFTDETRTPVAKRVAWYQNYIKDTGRKPKVEILNLTSTKQTPNKYARLPSQVSGAMTMHGTKFSLNTHRKIKHGTKYVVTTVPVKYKVDLVKSAREVKINNPNFSDMRMLYLDKYAYSQVPFDFIDFLDDMHEIADNIINSIDFEEVTKVTINKAQRDFILRVKIEKSIQQALLNDQIAPLKNDPVIMDFTQNILPNLKSRRLLEKYESVPQLKKSAKYKELQESLAKSNEMIENYKKATGMSDSDIALLELIGTTVNGLKNRDTLFKEIHAWTEMYKDDLPKNIQVAVENTIANYSKRNDLLNEAYIDDMLDDICMGIENYTNSTDLTNKSYKMDRLIKESGLADKETGIDLVEEELAKNPKLSESSRHGALYDATAQIMVWEKQHPNEHFTGVMIDIETSGLLDKYHNPVGKISEIAVIRRNKETGLIEQVNQIPKVKLSKAEFKAKYMPDEQARIAMGKTPDELYKAYTVTKDSEKYVTEDDVLTDFIMTLRQVYKEGVMTFNGNNFDLPYIAYRCKSTGVDLQATDFDLARTLGHKKVVNEMGTRYKTFNEMVQEDLNKEISQSIGKKYGDHIKDFYQEISTDRYQMSQEAKNNLREIIKRQVYRQLKLQDYAQFKVGFITEVNRPFVDGLAQALEGRTSDIFFKIYDNLDNEEVLSEGINRFSIAFTKHMAGELDNSLSEVLRSKVSESFSNLISTFKDIKTINNSLAEFPLSTSLFDLESEAFDLETHDVFKFLLLATIPKDSALFKTVSDPNYRINNLTALLSEGTDRPLLAFKKLIVPEDLPGHIQPTLKNLNTFTDFINNAKRVQSTIKNPDIVYKYANDIDEVITEIRNSEKIFNINKYLLNASEASLQTKYSQIKVMWNKLKANNSEVAAQVRKELMTKHPEFFKMLDDNVAHIKVKLNGNSVELVYPKFMDYNLEKQDQLKHKLLNNRLDKTSTKLGDTKNNGYKLDAYNAPDSSVTACKNCRNMYEATLTETGDPTKLTAAYNTTSRVFTDTINSYTLNHVLTKFTPKDIINWILNNSMTDHITIYKPIVTTFNNPVYFDEFLARSKEFKDMGLILKYDKATRALTIDIDSDIIKIKTNKNLYHNKTRYVYKVGNGDWTNSVAPIIPEISYEDFMSHITGNNKWKQALWDYRQSQIKICPELSGRLGLSNYEDFYKAVDVDPTHPLYRNTKPDYEMPLLYGDSFGASSDIMQGMGRGFDTNGYMMMDHLSNKLWNHTHTYYEYGVYVMESGLKLSSEYITKLSNSDLRKTLTNYPNYVVCYLTDNPKAVGGYELRRLNSYSDKVLNLARERGATIIPYDVYSSAAKHINNFTYGDVHLAMWAKYLQHCKQTWLINIGTFFRNAVDSTMKNFAEGNTISETSKSYMDAFILLNKYEQATKEIRKLDGMGRYSLKCAEEYFKNPKAILDKETYGMLYDFLEDSGINTLETLVTGTFGRLMKPNAYIERVSRLQFYLNLKKQGKEYSEIIRRISETHFNYDVKNYGDFLMQAIIPFWTYTSGNIHYMLHLIDENPSFIRNYFNFYTPIWDFDSLDYDELSANTSLQYQIINGDIPLNKLIPGYEDKEVIKQVKTKYGMKDVVVKNNATLKVGSSILDGMSMLVDPASSLKNKLAPPVQSIIDSALRFSQETLGIGAEEFSTPEEAEKYYNTLYSGVTAQSLIDNPLEIAEFIPALGVIKNKATYTDAEGKSHLGSRTYQRTEDPIITALGVAGISGATSRWGEFANSKNHKAVYEYPKRYGNYTKRPRMAYGKKVYHKRFTPANTYPGQGVTYRTNKKGYTYPYFTGSATRSYAQTNSPYSKYSAFMYNASHPNKIHNSIQRDRGYIMRSVPEYLNSNYGINSRGKSKYRSWNKMSAQYKTKSTLRRIVK